jgi:hypothetical protein
LIASEFLADAAAPVRHSATVAAIPKIFFICISL